MMPVTEIIKNCQHHMQKVLDYLAEELKGENIAVNSLWPKTIIYTAAITRLMGEGSMKNCRKPSIMADAAEWIFKQDPKEISGNLFLDEEVLHKAGINDLAKYNCTDDAELLPDLYIGT